MAFLRVNMKIKYSVCLSGMVGKQCGFKWHSDSRLSRLMLRTFTVYAHTLLV